MGVTRDYLREAFIYDDKAGYLIHRYNKGRNAKEGQVAGWVNSSGYRQVKIKGRCYLVHRLIWLLEHGYMPENSVDHKNRDRLKNTVDNLREATSVCNARNCKVRVTNRSGVKGVHWVEIHGKWKAEICLDNKRRYLGEFADFKEAVAHRFAAEQCLSWYTCESDSPASTIMRGTHA